MTLQIVSLILPAVMTLTAARSIDSDMRLEKLMAQLMEDYSTASNQRPPRPGPESMSEDERNAPTSASSQGLHQPDHAVAMFRKGHFLAVEPLTTGQIVEVVYKSPDYGRVYVNLEDTINNVILHVDARYVWYSDVNTLVLNTYDYQNRWLKQVEVNNFPFPSNGVQTTIHLQIVVRESEFLIVANGISLTTFAFRGILTPDTVSEVAVYLDDYGSSTPAEVEQISITY